MQVATPTERHPQHPVSVGSATSLPSIAHLTCSIPQQQQQQKQQHELSSPIHARQHRLSHQQQMLHQQQKMLHQQQEQQQQQQMELRDSGNWSLTQSKHSSTVSNATAGLQLQTILNTEDSPSRHTIPDTPSSGHPSYHPPSLPSLNHAFDHNRQSLETNPHNESRRSSIDSRMNSGMGHLHINPSPPYESQNASRVSLVSSLQRERGITTEPRTHNGSSAPLSPLDSRAGARVNNTPRRAPVINPNPRSVSGMPDPMAEKPTKGFPWAFPDLPVTAKPERTRASSDADSISVRSGTSRHDSIAALPNSDCFTAELPAGQKRFDDEVQTHHHHHSLQHRSVAALQNSESNMQTGGGNYSRTPELRVSHKMAERKRRSEMKQLFDELNAILPNSPGSKSSKWEILTKSIDYIKTLGKAHEAARVEMGRLRQDAEMHRRAQEDIDLLRNEVTALWHHVRILEPGKGHVYGNMTSFLSQQQAQTPSDGGAPAPAPVPPPSSGTITALPSMQSAAAPPWGTTSVMVGPAPPPLPPAQPLPQSSSSSSGAMQGIEFQAPRSYEHH